MSIPLLCVPVLNRYDLLDKMLDSINYPIDKILIINNGKEEYVNKNKNLNVIVLKFAIFYLKLYIHFFLSFYNYAYL